MSPVYALFIIRRLSTKCLKFGVPVTLIAASLWAKKQPNFKLVKTRICYELAREAPFIELTNAK